MLAVAAAVMMLACTATVWLARGRAELITVGRFGRVSWIAAGDSSRSTLQPGDQVRGGTLSVDGAAGSAELIFPDGTTIAANGDTELVLPSRPGKQLSLRLGASALTFALNPPVVRC